MACFGRIEKHFEKESIKMKLFRNIFVIFLVALLITSLWVLAVASDFHASDESHRVVYVVTDSSGNPVAGQTVRLAVQRSSDGFFLDFNNNTFAGSGWTTRLVTMNYDVTGEYYYRVISLDQAVRISNDIVCIISNDDATFSDQQVEVISFSDIKNLIRIHR